VGDAVQYVGSAGLDQFVNGEDGEHVHLVAKAAGGKRQTLPDLFAEPGIFACHNTGQQPALLELAGQADHVTFGAAESSVFIQQ
jgi:hypothetical protein